jgi:hypothetical protein
MTILTVYLFSNGLWILATLVFAIHVLVGTAMEAFK